MKSDASEPLSAADHYPIHPFATDHCSGGMTRLWNLCLRRDPPWNNCCVEHDWAYWLGGTKETRKKADIKLLCDVASLGHPYWAIVIYMAVRTGGHPALPFGWRWGYGWVRRGWGWSCERGYGQDA